MASDLSPSASSNYASPKSKSPSRVDSPYAYEAEAVQQAPVLYPDITVQLRGPWDMAILLLVFLAGGYAYKTLQLGRFATSSPETVEQHDGASMVWLLSALSFFILLLCLGALWPWSGGKGYDFNKYKAKGWMEGFTTSIQKMLQMMDPISLSASACLRLFADVMALRDLAQSRDWSAFTVKLSMLGLMGTVASMSTHRQTPSSLKKMPPLEMQGREASYLPPIVALLAFLQLLPATLILLHFPFFVASYDAAELARGLSLVHIPHILTALQETALVTETIPGFFLNIVLLTGTNLSPTSWQALFISTLNTGRSLILTFAEIDGYGTVSYRVMSLIGRFGERDSLNIFAELCWCCALWGQVYLCESGDIIVDSDFSFL